MKFPLEKWKNHVPNHQRALYATKPPTSFTIPLMSSKCLPWSWQTEISRAAPNFSEQSLNLSSRSWSARKNKQTKSIKTDPRRIVHFETQTHEERSWPWGSVVARTSYGFLFNVLGVTSPTSKHPWNTLCYTNIATEKYHFEEAGISSNYMLS